MTASVTTRHLTPDMLPGFAYPATPPHTTLERTTSLARVGIAAGATTAAVGLSGVGLLLARGRGQAVPTGLGAVAGSTWLKLGAAALGVGALVGAALYFTGRAHEQWMVHLAHQPDFSQAHDPSSVYAAIQQNWAEHAPPVEQELAHLKETGIVDSYEGYPAGGGFIVTVRHSQAGELQAQMRQVPDAGSIEHLES